MANLIDMESPVYLFVDECGDPNLVNIGKGSSRLFISVAVVFRGHDEVEYARANLENITKIFCGGGQLKSKNIANDHARRLEILRALDKINYSYYVVLVDKDRLLPGKGLSYRQSFFKFFNSMLFRKIAPSIACSFIIMADSHGKPAFVDSFEKYVKTEELPLFSDRCCYSQCASRDEPLIGIADFMAGTIAKLETESITTDIRNELMNIIMKKRLGIQRYPEFSKVEAGAFSDVFDNQIYIGNRRLAKEFVKVNANSDKDNILAQVMTTELLLECSDGDINGGRIYRKEIIQRLAFVGINGVNSDNFIQSVIGPIRDYGIIITGHRDGGYKIAETAADVREFLFINKNHLEPRIARISKARSHVKMFTNNGFDILDDNEFATISKIVNSIG